MQSDNSPAHPAALPAAIGSELAHLVAMQQQVLEDMKVLGSFTPAHIAMLEGALERAHQLAVRSQQLARLAGGRLRQSHEKLQLHAIVDDVLASRRKTWRGQGVQVQRHLKMVEVVVDPGLLVSAVEAAVDWAMEQGKLIIVNLEMKNWPQHALLKIKSTQAVRLREEDSREPEDTLSWHLLTATARALGALIKRNAGDDGVELILEFPRTVNQLEGMTALDKEVATHSHLSSAVSESQPLAGLRLLLVSDDAKVRRVVDDVCDLMGLRLDNTPSSDKATRFCELTQPDAIVVDERMRDATFEQLRAELIKHHPGLPVIEVSTQPNRFQMSTWESASSSCISLEDLRSKLPHILLGELGRVY